MESLESRLLFAFGVTATTGGLASYTIDNGGNLKFSVLRETATNLSSTIHVGDMTSIKYKGQEMLASYSVTSRYSHYEQGLSSTTKVSYVVDNTNGWILVKCDDSATASDASQYYVVRKNDDNIYMASLPSDVTAGPGEGRFIAYLDRNVFANPEAPSDNAGTTGAIEGSDVYGHADGTTSSKFYNMGRRMIENVYHGLTGTAGTTAVGAWMFMGNREHSAGGPFFKDIDFQSGSAVEMYNCIFTGHTQTESFRQGLHVYAMQFTSGSLPTTPDYSWLETLKDSGGNFLISGLVPASARGTLSGVASGVPAGHEVTVGLANSDAQYWDAADSAGNYVITGIQPGTYTETLYDGELEVGTKTVTITAGHTTSSNILDTFYSPTPTWRIGTWDGTPLGFMNSEPAYPGGPGKIEIMHPSDVRMTNWGSTPNFVIGTNTDSQWPLAQFMGVNNSQRITFQLTSAQASVGQTLRIGITWGFSGARPKITVNAGQTGAWTSANPSASSDLNSRGITRGTWRGDNQLYTFNIPTSALKVGTNTIDLPLISGSYVAGQTWLSPNVAYDAIDLVPTSAASIPTIASVTITPLNSSVAPNGTKVFTAVAKDAAGNVVNANFSWSAARGTIDGNGSYIAPATEGADTITVTATNNPRTAGYSTSSSSTSAFAATTSATSGTTVNVMGTVPIVVNPASANPNPAPYGSTVLSVLGNDDGGEANLKYTWSVVGTSPGGVTFSANGTNTAKTTTATFSAQGTYNFLVTIADQNGNTRTSSVSVNATQNIAWYQNDVSAGPTLPDSFGNGLDATANGSYGIVPGVSGNAVQLAGGNVTMPAGILSALNNFTIATWVKLDSIATWARVFDFGTGTTNYMFLTPQSSAGVVRFAIRTPAVSEQDLDGSFTVPSGASAPWTHIAVTFALNSGSTTNYTGTLYVNGVAIATKTNFTLKPSSLGSTTQNYIGESQFSADPSLMGSVDDFRIYARALSGTEVKALAGGTVSGTAFNDVNANGAFDSGEPTLSGVQVYLDANNNRVLDGSELSTTTGAAGNYAFSNVPAGSYTVREVAAPAGFAQATAPAVTVGNATSAAADVGNAQIVYSGTAGNDNYTVRKNSSGQYQILIGGSLAYTVFAGAPSLTFNLLGGNDVLTVDDANGIPAPPAGISIDGGTGTNLMTVSGTSGADTATFSASSATIAGASFSEANIAAVTFDGQGGWDTVSVTGGPAVTFANAQQLQSLALSGSAAAALADGSTAALITRSLAVASTASLDLKTGALVVDDATALGSWNGSAYTGVTGMIAGGAVRSSAVSDGYTALGIASGQDALGLGASETTTWQGQTVRGSSVLVKYTYAGDANLDGVVNIDDYTQIDSSVSVGGSLKGWFNGDFNLDGEVNIDDYTAIDSVISIQGPPL